MTELQDATTTVENAALHNTVIEEVQKGYKFNDKVIRPSKVKVSVKLAKLKSKPKPDKKPKGKPKEKPKGKPKEKPKGKPKKKPEGKPKSKDKLKARAGKKKRPGKKSKSFGD